MATYPDHGFPSSKKRRLEYDYFQSDGPSVSYGQNFNQSTPHYETQNDQTNLIVNYLPQQLLDEEFGQLFANFGPLESAKIMRDKKTGYSFGYGFVNYVDGRGARAAITKLNGFLIHNKRMKVSYARPPSDDIKDTNLYITNLPRDTTEEDLDLLFSSFGSIVQKNILRDKYTHLPRGVAFVRFNLREEANRAIEAMNEFVPPGAEEGIKVRLAENHGKQKANYLAGFQAGYQQQKRYY